MSQYRPNPPQDFSFDVLPYTELRGFDRHRQVMLFMGSNARGVFTATQFLPPYTETRPWDIFVIRRLYTPQTDNQDEDPNNQAPGVFRFCIKDSMIPCFPMPRRTVGVFTSGACMIRTSPDAPRGRLCGGWAYLFSDRLTGLVPGREHSGTVYGALGDTGVDGLPSEHTDNRADLRAVVEALQGSAELGIGWDRIVVMTHSEYVVDGMTKNLRLWAGSGWLTPTGIPMTKDKDL